MATSTSQSNPYQGYPYVSPHAVDAPSLTPRQVAELAKYNNLPRRHLRNDGAGSSQSPNPMVPSKQSQKENEETPVVYIDIPSEASGSGESVAREPAQQTSAPSKAQSNDEDDTPVVYINLPEVDGSGVSMVRESDRGPDFVQQTIFYDPFKDRRIDTPGSETGPSSFQSQRPPRPNYLQINSPGSSGQSSSTQSPIVPNFMSKESYIYGNRPHSDDFNLTPLPVTDFPKPPPSYEEANRQETRPAQSPIQDPPRTTVILPGSVPANTVVGLPQPDRKLLTCQFCGSRVHSLVVKETGLYTHVIAFLVLLFCFILTPLVYILDSCKYKNHYCPSCNEKVAFEFPCGFFGLQIVTPF